MGGILELIFYDPSEGRSNSALPQRIKDVGFTLPGLEARTGADILITPIEDEWLAGKNISKPPASIRLFSFLESAMLIQRKTGADMLQSISHLDDQQIRMVSIQDEMKDKGLKIPSIWLLKIGLYEPLMVNSEKDAKRLGLPVSTVGRVLVRRDGIHAETWLWSALRGCEDRWMLRGGNIAPEPWDSTAVEWLLRWNENLYRLKDEHVVIRHQGMVKDEDPKTHLIMGLPNCGPVIANTLISEFGSPSKVFEWILKNGTGVKGVGEKRIEEWRKILKLD